MSISISLLGWLGLTFRSRIFRSYGNVTIVGEELQSINLCRHPRSLNRDLTLSYHTPCDTGLAFAVSSEVIKPPGYRGLTL